MWWIMILRSHVLIVQNVNSRDQCTMHIIINPRIAS